jgi:WD40 repeat protein/serine/threonine protein kinase
MTNAERHLMTLFAEALEFTSPPERAAYLDRACANDQDLRQHLEALLEAHAQVGCFLDPQAAVAGATASAAGKEIAEAVGSRTALPPAGTEGPGTQIGPYKLLEQIGEGGMGTVWMAQQTEPVKRLVAVKLIKAGMDSKQVIARFEAERQALALMDHANIARVLDAGTSSTGRPYFVMDLVKGVPITRYCDEHRLTPRQRLELFLPVCRAVQHAHQKGVIHRDLKPSNVLVALYDGQPVPKVIDFGVAKAAGQPLTDKTLVTGFGSIIGTLEYMSPEQAEINQLDIDTRSDIYSLGILLYELLAGTTPLERKRVNKSGILEALRIIREEEVPTLSNRLSTMGELPAIAANRGLEPAKLTKLVRGELDWIVMKALEKDRNRRYETASAFAADVQRYLADEPVQACPPSAWYRFRKLARRHRRAVIPVSAVALAAVVGVAALAVSTALVWRANRDLKESLDRELRDGYFHRITLAHRELSRDNLGRARGHLDQCPAELRQWEWHYLTRLCRFEPLVLRHKAMVNSLAFSPGGEWIAGAGGDGTIKVWNSRTGAEVQAFVAHTDSVYSVAFHPGGRYLASTGTDEKVGKVKVWDWATGREKFAGPCGADHDRGTAYCVAFSPDGRRLAAGNDGAVTIFDWETHQPVLPPLRGHVNKGICVAFSPDGGRLASGSWDGVIRIWDAVTGELLRTLSEHHHPVSALAFNRDGTRLVSACFDRSLIVWDATTGRRLRTLKGHDGLVLGVAFSPDPDGSRIASAGEDKTVRIWETTTGREVLDLRGHIESSQGIAFSSDGLRLASGSWDRTIRVWDATPVGANERQEALTFNRHTGEVWTVAVSPDGRSIASAGLGGVETPVKVWDVSSGRENFEFSGHGAIVFCVAWHPDGEWIASSGMDDERKLFVVKVWNARTRAVGFEVAAGPMETPAVAFSPDGEYLVTGGAQGAVQVWNARTGAEVRTLHTHDRQIQGLAFSGKGGHLASASADGAIKLWDATRLGEEQTPRHVFQGRVGMGVRTLAFSPDGRRLVAGGAKNTVKIWDVQTERELQSLDGHSGDVWATAFSPDPEGRWVASAGEDSTVKVWDSRTGELVHSFRGHTGLISSLAFSRDGRQLFSGSRDKTVMVWNLTQPGEGPGR